MNNSNSTFSGRDYDISLNLTVYNCYFFTFLQEEIKTYIHSVSPIRHHRFVSTSRLQRILENAQVSLESRVHTSRQSTRWY